MLWALHFLALAALVAVATWSFSVTYGTRATLDRVAQLNREIAAEREALVVLEAEWAWLNAPDRLLALVAAQGIELGLEPLSPERFGEVAEAPLAEPDDGMEPVALIDLDALSPEDPASRRRASDDTAPQRRAAITPPETREPAPRRAAPPNEAATPVPASVPPAALPVTPAAPARAPVWTAPERIER